MNKGSKQKDDITNPIFPAKPYKTKGNSKPMKTRNPPNSNNSNNNTDTPPQEKEKDVDFTSLTTDEKLDLLLQQDVKYTKRHN